MGCAGLVCVIVAVEAVVCVVLPHAASSSAGAVSARRFMRVDCKSRQADTGSLLRRIHAAGNA